MSKSGGRILVEEAYAQGKMLDSSAWAGDFPRGITPSDIDYVLESDGYFLFAEFNRGPGTFDAMSKGQRILYSNLCSLSPNCVVAVVGHNAPRDRAICTKTDIESLEVRHHSGYQYQTQCPQEAKEKWVSINKKIVESPSQLVRCLTTQASRGKA